MTVLTEHKICYGCVCVFDEWWWVAPSTVFVSLLHTYTRYEHKKLADQFQMDCSECWSHTLDLGLAGKSFTQCIRPLCQMHLSVGTFLCVCSSVQRKSVVIM